MGQDPKIPGDRGADASGDQGVKVRKDPTNKTRAEIPQKIETAPFNLRVTPMEGTSLVEAEF
jgi:hypothetical protein